MAKFKLPNKFNKDRMYITNDMWISKGLKHDDGTQVYDYMHNSAGKVDEIVVTPEDLTRREITLSGGDFLMNALNSGKFSEKEKVWFMMKILHTIHPSLKDEVSSVS